MYYFKAEIPRHSDGTIAKYPPGWHGVLARCPQNVTVHLYNDRDAYLIASSSDSFVPLEVEVLNEAGALILLSEFADALPSDGIYLGDNIEARWQADAERKVAEEAVLNGG